MPAPAPARVDAQEPGAAQVRVLVVDDEAGVGRAPGRILAPLNVLFAQSPAGALGRISAGGDFSAVVCDVKMPGMNGMQFYDEVAKLDTGHAKRFVYVTGATPPPEFRDFLEWTGCPCLEKPFVNQELRNAVRAVMRSGPSARVREAPR